MLLELPDGAEIIIVEPPHTGTTSLRQWAKLTWNNVAWRKQPLDRHATALEILAALGEQRFFTAHRYACTRHPKPRAITACIGLYRAPPKRYKREMRLFHACRPGRPPATRTWWPQVKHTHDDEFRPLVDAYLPLENRAQLLEILAERHGLPKAEYPHLNRTRNKPHWNALPSSFRRAATQVYADDCNHLGYSWDAEPPASCGLTIPRQPPEPGRAALGNTGLATHR